MSGFYTRAVEGFLCGTLSWTLDDIRAGLVEEGYEFDPEAPFGEIPLVATSVPLTGRTAKGGEAGSDEVRFVGVAGRPVGGLLLFKKTGGNDGLPIVFIGESDDSGVPFPIAPNGGDIVLAPSSRWFAL